MQEEKPKPTEAEGGSSDDLEPGDVVGNEEGGGETGDAGAEAGNGPSEGSPKPKRQSRADDARFAAQRRKNKASGGEGGVPDEERDRIRREAAFEVKKDYVKPDTLRELGLDSIETEDDLALAEAYEKAVADGEENPVAVAYRTLRNRDAEARRQRDEQEAERARLRASIAKEQADFKKEFGVETWEVMDGGNSEFAKKFGHLIRPGNFAELYRVYRSYTQEGRDAAKAKGVPPTNGGNPPAKPKDVSEMDREEFDAYFHTKYHL